MYLQRNAYCHLTNTDLWGVTETTVRVLLCCSVAQISFTETWEQWRIFPVLKHRCILNFAFSEWVLQWFIFFISWGVTYAVTVSFAEWTQCIRSWTLSSLRSWENVSMWRLWKYFQEEIGPETASAQTHWTQTELLQRVWEKLPHAKCIKAPWTDPQWG